MLVAAGLARRPLGAPKGLVCGYTKAWMRAKSLQRGYNGEGTRTQDVMHDVYEYEQTAGDMDHRWHIGMVGC